MKNFEDSDLLEVQVKCSCIHQLPHLPAILVHRRAHLLVVEEEVCNLPPLSGDDGHEDAVQVLPVQGLEAGGYAAVQYHQLGVVHAGVLDQDISRVEVAVDKIVHKQLQDAIVIEDGPPV